MNNTPAIDTEMTADVIAELEEFPNPNLAWAAFRADVLTEPQVLHALRDRRTRHQRFMDALSDIFSA